MSWIAFVYTKLLFTWDNGIISGSIIDAAYGVASAMTLSSWRAVSARRQWNRRQNPNPHTVNPNLDTDSCR
jgi:hypothetical protein